jgi:hypothetical protein
VVARTQAINKYFLLALNRIRQQTTGSGSEDGQKNVLKKVSRRMKKKIDNSELNLFSVVVVIAVVTFLS